MGAEACGAFLLMEQDICSTSGGLGQPYNWGVLGQDLLDRGDETLVLAAGAVADADVTRRSETGPGPHRHPAACKPVHDVRLLPVAEVDPAEVRLALGRG